jgi:hypothetical protein
MCGHRAKLDRPHLHTPNAVISTEATDSLIVCRAVERPPHFGFAFVVALAVAVASEIGPGFSPDIYGQQKEPGFSPWDMLSSPRRLMLSKAIASSFTQLAGPENFERPATTSSYNPPTINATITAAKTCMNSGFG